MNVTSIDFETANCSRVSICAAGLAVFEDGTLTEAPYWLVRPPKGKGWFRNDFTEIHGLTHLDVLDAPEFPAIALVLLARLTLSELVIAHTAVFELDHLRVILDRFRLWYPEFHYFCTYPVIEHIWPDMPEHRVNNLAAHIGHEFRHHHTQPDAEAAGRVLLALLKRESANMPSGLMQRDGIGPRRFCR
jgi:DNA polymerase-3 subunit epsilon